LFSLKSKDLSSINVLLFKLISAVIYKNNCTVGLKQKFQIRRNRILSIRQISDFGKSVGFGFGICHIPKHSTSEELSLTRSLLTQ